MSKITSGQIRKIFVLKRELGLDDDTLRSYIYNLVKKDSLKALTIHEAIKVIDSLDNTTEEQPNRISVKQQKYIRGLAIKCGFANEKKELDTVKLNKWLENRYHVSNILWLTPKNASDAIEGLKAIRNRNAGNPANEEENLCTVQ